MCRVFKYYIHIYVLYSIKVTFCLVMLGEICKISCQNAGMEMPNMVYKIPILEAYNKYAHELKKNIALKMTIKKQGKFLVAIKGSSFPWKPCMSSPSDALSSMAISYN